MFDRIEFVIGEAFQGMRRHALMSIAAITTVAIALYLFGGLTYLYMGINRYAHDLSGKYEIQAYFKDGTSVEAIKAAAQDLRKQSGIARVVWIPRDKAWEKEIKKNPQLTSGIDNPFPDALKITMADLGQVQNVVGAVKTTRGIEPSQVMYHDPTQRFLNDMLKLIQWLGVVIGGLLLATAGVLIYNAIRLAIDARKREIRIMQLVGASHFTVRVPFLVEGGFQGLVGGVIATLLLWGTYSGIDWYIANNLSAIHMGATFPLATAAMSLGLAGCAYGMICSILAIRGPSRLRSQGI